MAAESLSLPQSLATALVEQVAAFNRHGIRYAIIGGIAAAFRSRPRFTSDLDVLLEVPQVTLPRLLDDLADRQFEFAAPDVIREWTHHHMASITFQSVGVDWLKAILPCYQRVLDRAQCERLFGQDCTIASSEGLILMKLIAYRSQDRVDVENLLAASQVELDLDFVRRELKSVFEIDDARIQEFESMVTRYYHGG